MKNLSNKEQQFLLQLIKSCEFYDNLDEKGSIDAISKALGKDISRRTYYNYKKKLYDKEIFAKLKDTMYDTKEMKCLLLEMEETNKVESIKAHKLIADQFPDRKDIFHEEDKQMKELEKTNEKIRAINDKFNDITGSIKRNCQSIHENVTIRKEFVKCGKETCNLCPHGPYFYAYFKDKTKDNKKSKLRKKYMGTTDPRH